jgi:hypothetical protein
MDTIGPGNVFIVSSGLVGRTTRRVLAASISSRAAFADRDLNIGVLALSLRHAV